MSVTGSFTVNAPLGPMPLTDISASILSYSFNDGRHTLTNSNSQFFGPAVEVDGAGQITAWVFRFAQRDDGDGLTIGDQIIRLGTSAFNEPYLTVSDTAELRECTYVDCVFSGVDIVQIKNSPGSWTVVSIPAAVWLFSSALGVLGWTKRKT